MSAAEDEDDVSQLVVVGSDGCVSPADLPPLYDKPGATDPPAASCRSVATLPLPLIVVQTCSAEECAANECPTKAGSSSSAAAISRCPSSVRMMQFSPFSSTQSSMLPVCRICQCFGSSSDTSGGMAAMPPDASWPLISPCRCTGTLQFVHPQCLRKWLEVRDKIKMADNGNQAPSCELCGYTYRMRKQLMFTKWKCPSVTAKDRILHAVFFICLLSVGCCGAAAILCFVTSGEGIGLTPTTDKVDLSREEVVSLSCGIGAFVSFFIAMAAEIKAQQTIFRICRNCVQLNTVWFLENYVADSKDVYGAYARNASLV